MGDVDLDALDEREDKLCQYKEETKTEEVEAEIHKRNQK